MAQVRLVRASMVLQKSFLITLAAAVVTAIATPAIASTQGSSSDKPIDLKNLMHIADEAGTTLPRIGGVNGYETALQISRLQFPAGAKTAYIARGDLATDAIAAGAANNGPLLLVPPAVKSNQLISILAELKRLGSPRLIAVGGTRSVSDSTMKALTKGGTFSRIGGKNRYLTSIAFSKFAYPKAGVATDVYLVNGLKLADSAVAGQLKKGPVLLHDGSRRLSKEIKAEISRLNPKRIVLIGGPVSLPTTDASKSFPGIPEVRLGGIDRYEVSVSVAREAFPGVLKRLYLVGGEQYIHAALAASVEDAATVLVPAGEMIPQALRTILRVCEPKVFAVGSELHVSDRMVRKAIELATPIRHSPPGGGAQPPAGGDTGSSGIVRRSGLGGVKIGGFSATTNQSSNRITARVGSATSEAKIALDELIQLTGSIVHQPFELTSSHPLASPVELKYVFPVALPEGSRAQYLTYDEERKAWTPMGGQLSSDRRELTLKVSHFSLWTPEVNVPRINTNAVLKGFSDTGRLVVKSSVAALDGINKATERYVDAFAYGAGAIFDKRVSEPICDSLETPSWASNVTHGENTLNTPILWCAGAYGSDKSKLQVKLRVNRGFGYRVTFGVAPESVKNSMLDGEFMDVLKEFVTDTPGNFSEMAKIGYESSFENQQYVRGGGELTAIFTKAQVKEAVRNLGQPLVTSTPIDGKSFLKYMALDLMVDWAMGKIEASPYMQILAIYLALGSAWKCQSEIEKTDIISSGPTCIKTILKTTDVLTKFEASDTYLTKHRFSSKAMGSTVKQLFGDAGFLARLDWYFTGWKIVQQSADYAASVSLGSYKLHSSVRYEPGDEPTEGSGGTPVDTCPQGIITLAVSPTAANLNSSSSGIVVSYAGLTPSCRYKITATNRSEHTEVTFSPTTSQGSVSLLISLNNTPGYSPVDVELFNERGVLLGRGSDPNGFGPRS